MLAVRAFADLHPLVEVVSVSLDSVIDFLDRRELFQRRLDHSKKLCAAATARRASELVVNAFVKIHIRGAASYINALQNAGGFGRRKAAVASSFFVFVRPVEQRLKRCSCDRFCLWDLPRDRINFCAIVGIRIELFVRKIKFDRRRLLTLRESRTRNKQQHRRQSK